MMADADVLLEFVSATRWFTIPPGLAQSLLHRGYGYGSVTLARWRLQFAPRSQMSLLMGIVD